MPLKGKISETQISSFENEPVRENDKLDRLETGLWTVSSCVVLQAKMANLGENGQKSVAIYSHVSLATLDVILRCAFSYEGDIQAQG